MDSHFTFTQLMPQKHIKTECFGSPYSLISPPTTPSPPSLLSSRSSSVSSLASPKRPRPYPLLSREPSLRKEEIATMSNTPAYPSWSRPHHPVDRKSSDGDTLAGYGVPSQFVNNGPYGGSDLGSISSSSTLTGAMGEPTIHSRHSSPPNTSSGRRMYANAQNHNLMWNNNAHPSMTMNTYPSVSGHGAMSFADMSSSLMGMNDYATNRSNPSPVSLSPHSSNYPAHLEQFGQGRSSAQPSGGNGMTQGVCVSPPSTPSGGHTDDEVNRLRRRVRELEMENRNMVESLRRSATAGPPLSASFQNSWRARTEARMRVFCSLNRAGNALCAWHDSRRERRIYAPRQAPHGFLNCGCTYEEALFEESLSRNGVGSYLPGEAVRMDPALRLPLLRLLEKRYGYKDGDFERDPSVERWAEGESPSTWEQKAQSGYTVRRRPEADRH